MKKNFRAFARWGAALLLAAGLSGCVVVKKAYEPNPIPAPQMPVAQAANPVRQPAQPADGSLWNPDLGVNPFAGDKAFRRGDIVLVRVVQKNTGTKKANTGTARKSSIAGKIKYLFGAEDSINKLTTDEATLASGGDPNNLIEATSSNEFKGEGSTERSDQLTATVSALVTDVLANGNLVIYGHQVVRLNSESSVLTVQGIVRPSDISDNNEIDSSRIANADIQFTGSGALTDKQHPGWGTRVFDWVWPF